MSADYSADHARAYADVLASGDVAVFTLAGQGTYDPSTDAETGSTDDLVVSGVAIEKKGSLLTYQQLSLIAANARTLFFVGDNYGDVPPLNGLVTWGGSQYAVKHVAPIGPAGQAIAATVVISL